MYIGNHTYIIPFIIWMFQEKSVTGWLKHLKENIILQPLDCVKVSVPSLVYTLQNNLIFIGVSNLDAAVFQVPCNTSRSSCKQKSHVIILIINYMIILGMRRYVHHMIRYVLKRKYFKPVEY